MDGNIFFYIIFICLIYFESVIHEKTESSLWFVMLHAIKRFRRFFDNQKTYLASCKLID